MAREKDAAIRARCRVSWRTRRNSTQWLLLTNARRLRASRSTSKSSWKTTRRRSNTGSGKGEGERNYFEEGGGSEAGAGYLRSSRSTGVALGGAASKSRASLEKELSAARNTIMELRDEVADFRLIPSVDRTLVSSRRPSSASKKRGHLLDANQQRGQRRGYPRRCRIRCNATAGTTAQGGASKACHSRARPFPRMGCQRRW